MRPDSVLVLGLIAQARATARERALSPTQAHVLLLLATHVDRASGEAWAGVELLAKEAGRGTSVVSDALRELTELGLIERRRRGPGRSAVTRLLIADRPRVETSDEPEVWGPDLRPAGDQDPRPAGVKTSDEPEVPVERTKNGPERTAAGRAPHAARIDRCLADLGLPMAAEDVDQLLASFPGRDVEHVTTQIEAWHRNRGPIKRPAAALRTVLESAPRTKLADLEAADDDDRAAYLAGLDELRSASRAFDLWFSDASLLGRRPDGRLVVRAAAGSHPERWQRLVGKAFRGRAIELVSPAVSPQLTVIEAAA